MKRHNPARHFPPNLYRMECISVYSQGYPAIDSEEPYIMQKGGKCGELQVALSLSASIFFLDAFADDPALSSVLFFYVLP